MPVFTPDAPAYKIPDRPETAGEIPVSQRITDEARAEGRLDAMGNPDMSGLVIQQEGLIYHINQRVLPVETTVRRRTGPRQFKLGLPPWPLEARLSRFDEFLRNKYEDYPGEERQVVVDVDVYDSGGNLISKDYFDGTRIDPYNRTPHRHLLAKYPDGLGEFLLFLDSHRKGRAAHEQDLGKFGQTMGRHLHTRFGNDVLPREPITGWAWEDKAKKPLPPAQLKPEERHDVPMHFEKGEDRFKKIFRYREQLGLPGDSWYGLTMTMDGRILQVTHDELRQPIHILPEGAPRNRVWEITELRWNEAAGEYEEIKGDRRFYVDEEMRDLVNGADGDVTDIHWEIPNEIWRSRHHAAELGRKALKLAGVPGSLAESKTYESHLSLGEAYELLSSPDLYGEAKVKELVAELRADPEQRKFAVALKETIAEHGMDAVNELALQLRNKYIWAAGKLGLPVPTEKKSLSWALREIAEQRYFAAHPDEAEPSRRSDRFGVEVGDPFSNEYIEAERKRREIIDYQIGLAFINNAQAIQVVVDGDPYKAVDDDLEVSLSHRGKLTFRVNEQLLNTVQEFAKPSIQEILEVIANGKNADFLTRAAKLSKAELKIIFDAANAGKNVGAQPDRAYVVSAGRWLRRQLVQ